MFSWSGTYPQESVKNCCHSIFASIWNFRSDDITKRKDLASVSKTKEDYLEYLDLLWLGCTVKDLKYIRLEMQTKYLKFLVSQEQFEIKPFYM